MTNRYTIAAAVLTVALTSQWVRAQDTKDQGAQDKGDQGKSQKMSATEAAQKYLKYHDKNNDGSLSRDELPAGMRDGFADLDANKDGKLSADELKQHGERMVFVPIPVPVEIVSLYVVEAAADSPSRDELQKAYDVLRKADGNNDGQLSQQEVQAAREHAIQQRVDAVFKRCDKNGDGKVSKEEVPADMAGLFGRTDKDNNGSITKEELKQCYMTPPDEAGKAGGAASNAGRQ